MDIRVRPAPLMQEPDVSTPRPALAYYGRVAPKHPQTGNKLEGQGGMPGSQLRTAKKRKLKQKSVTYDQNLPVTSNLVFTVNPPISYPVPVSAPAFDPGFLPDRFIVGSQLSSSASRLQPISTTGTPFRPPTPQQNTATFPVPGFLGQGTFIAGNQPAPSTSRCPPTFATGTPIRSQPPTTMTVPTRVLTVPNQGNASMNSRYQTPLQPTTPVLQHANHSTTTAPDPGLPVLGQSIVEPTAQQQLQSSRFHPTMMKSLKFDGTEKGEDWSAVLVKFEIFAEAARWTDREKRNQLCLCFTGGASRYGTNVLRHNKDLTYAQLVGKMEQRFNHGNEIETLQVQFHSARQSPGESTDQWSDRLTALADKAFRDLPEHYVQSH